MTFTRTVFAFALLMLILGIFASRALASMLFPAAPQEPSLLAAAPTATRTAPTSTGARPVGTGVSRGAQPRPSKTAVPRSTASPTPTATPTLIGTPSPTPTPILTPSPIPTSGTVTLSRYWIGTSQAHPGETIAVGYVIDNGTGVTQHLMLGASVKSSLILNWATGSLSDPWHDVVATVPPGSSVHTRFFTLPSSLHPGAYDVAWGLRDSTTGQRDALTTAAAALRVAG